MYVLLNVWVIKMKVCAVWEAIGGVNRVNGVDITIKIALNGVVGHVY